MDTRSDVFVRWVERTFYVTVFAATGWQIWQLPDTYREMTEPSVFLPAYVGAVTAWLYALGTRTRKPFKKKPEG